MKNNKNITLLWLLIFMSSTQWVSAQLFGGRPIMKKPSVTVNCNAIGFVGDFMAGSVINGSSFKVILINNTSNQIVINFAAADLQITGVTGLTVGTPTSSPALSSGNATINGGSSVTVTYPLTGTLPNTCGNITGTWTKLTPLTLSCQKVKSISPNFLKAVTDITFSGNNLTGFTVNWNAISGATGFTLERSTTKTGPWVEFLSNPYTGTSASVTGISNGILFFRITVIGGTCDGASLIRPVGCFAPTSNGGFLRFMCHNLGADTSADPFTPSWRLNGSYTQWGTFPNMWTTSNVPGSGFATAPTATNPHSGSFGNWNQGLQTDATAWNLGTESNPIKQDMCPAGFRIPTNQEWNAVIAGINSSGNVERFGEIVSSPTNYSSGLLINKTLYLPYNGKRAFDNGFLENRGFEALYWTSQLNTSQFVWRNSFVFVGQSFIATSAHDSRTGGGIRCIAQ